MTSSAIVNMFAEDQNIIIYRPKMSRVLGSTSAILLSQILYWEHKKGGAFYKYRSPCKASKPGDSWCEELGFSTGEFDTALKRIGTKIKTGDTKERVLLNASKLPMTINSGAELGFEAETHDEHVKRIKHHFKALVIYWTDSNRKTWYMINETLLDDLGNRIYLSNSDFHSYLTRDSVFTYTTETTTETTSDLLTSKNEVSTAAQISEGKIMADGDGHPIKYRDCKWFNSCKKLQAGYFFIGGERICPAYAPSESPGDRCYRCRDSYPIADMHAGICNGHNIHYCQKCVGSVQGIEKDLLDEHLGAISEKPDGDGQPSKQEAGIVDDSSNTAYDRYVAGEQAALEALAVNPAPSAQPVTACNSDDAAMQELRRGEPGSLIDEDLLDHTPLPLGICSACGKPCGDDVKLCEEHQAEFAGDLEVVLTAEQAKALNVFDDNGNIPIGQAKQSPYWTVLHRLMDNGYVGLIIGSGNLHITDQGRAALKARQIELPEPCVHCLEHEVCDYIFREEIGDDTIQPCAAFKAYQTQQPELTQEQVGEIFKPAEQGAADWTKIPVGDELPEMPESMSEMLMQSLDENFRIDCKRYAGGCKLLMSPDVTCLECKSFVALKTDEHIGALCEVEDSYATITVGDDIAPETLEALGGMVAAAHKAVKAGTLPKKKPTKKPRKPKRTPEQKQAEDNMFEAVKFVWRLTNDGNYKIIKMKQFFLSTIKKTSKKYGEEFRLNQLDEIPATALEVVAFGHWYRTEYDNVSLPESGSKLRSHFETFRGSGDRYDSFIRKATNTIREKLPKIFIDGISEPPKPDEPEEEIMVLTDEQKQQMADLMDSIGRGGVE